MTYSSPIYDEAYEANILGPSVAVLFNAFSKTKFYLSGGVLTDQPCIVDSFYEDPWAAPVEASRM
jgi:hypothetical protein